MKLQIQKLMKTAINLESHGVAEERIHKQEYKLKINKMPRFKIKIKNQVNAKIQHPKPVDVSMVFMISCTCVSIALVVRIELFTVFSTC